jgi:hypothetical protein
MSNVQIFAGSTDTINSCRCRHEFCYLCLGKWQTCNCPAWDERNIINAPHPAPVAAPAAVGPAIARNHVPIVVAPNVAAAGVQPAIFPPKPAPVVAPAAMAPVPGPLLWANHAPLMHAYQAPGYAAPMHPPPPVYLPFAAPIPAYQALPVVGNPAPALFGGYGPVPIARPHVPICDLQGHDFECFYRSSGWRTRCQFCRHEDRWVNYCLTCDLTVCRYCTKHRL